MDISATLKQLREERGWTQAATARAAGVPARSYQNWEEGIRQPRLDAIVRLAAGFGVTTDALLTATSGVTTTEGSMR